MLGRGRGIEGKTGDLWGRREKKCFLRIKGSGEKQKLSQGLRELGGLMGFFFFQFFDDKNTIFCHLNQFLVVRNEQKQI